MILSSFTVLSCKDIEVKDDPVPVISIESITPNNIKQFSDSVTISIRYKDGDGDLGSADADIRSLSIRDTRLSKEDTYFVAPLAPLDAKISIEGILKIQLRNLFLLGNGASETTKFEVRIKDRAGHESNLAVSELVTITK